jgi:hypothetical protein
MTISTIKNELHNILSGKSEVSDGASIQAITRYLRERLRTSEETQGNESNKGEETKKLIVSTSMRIIFGVVILTSVCLFPLVQNNGCISKTHVKF